ncbi:XRE family transcriptional regulator [Lentzea tibetensis]|uniref:XRE family transcriptional regulator n=1 Tax=Lentzea tibetensis TaxID=2591470 RepID=A0A563EUY5_9PSEU|nr:XRE family transcriptional regulator [Lentzea tibetensis]TWP51479.1 XRE family transcriptional regulator [Lentzea tibetensis]
MTNEAFAQHLGVAVRTIATWHQRADITPVREMQELLDTALERAPESARERFMRKANGSTVAVATSTFERTDDVSRAARESLEFASWALSEQVDPLILDHVQYELRRVAVDYVHAPLKPVFDDLIRLRDVTFGLVRERPHPKQSRELFFLTGTNLLLLAHASQNLGEPGSGMAQARAAAACAEQADHDGLRAWVAGTQALIAEWTRRCSEAVDFARRGQEFAVTAESRGRLASLEARCLARTGKKEEALVALARAQRAWDTGPESDDLGEFGGLLTFPAAKANYYAGGVLSLVGEHEQAERAALKAISMYENGLVEDRSYGDEALARVDVAIARLARGEVDGAGDALRPVFALPSEQRIQQLRDGLNRVTRTLALPNYTGSAEAKQLTEAVHEFVVPRPDRRAIG